MKVAYTLTTTLVVQLVAIISIWILIDLAGGDRGRRVLHLCCSFCRCAAVSGETMLGNYKLLPRAGFEGAWSPGGEADFDASRGLIEQGGALSTGEVVGLRLFGELRFEDLLTEHVEQLAVTPMVFCDRPMGEAFNACGAGLSFSLSREDEDTGVRYGIELTGEKTRTSEMFGVQMNYSQPFLGGEVTGTSSVSRNGHIAVGANYALEF